MLKDKTEEAYSFDFWGFRWAGRSARSAFFYFRQLCWKNTRVLIQSNAEQGGIG